jgi:hypothetical protein
MLGPQRTHTPPTQSGAAACSQATPDIALVHEPWQGCTPLARTANTAHGGYSRQTADQPLFELLPRAKEISYKHENNGASSHFCGQQFTCFFLIVRCFFRALAQAKP